MIGRSAHRRQSERRSTEQMAQTADRAMPGFPSGDPDPVDMSRNGSDAWADGLAIGVEMRLREARQLLAHAVALADSENTTALEVFLRANRGQVFDVALIAVTMLAFDIPASSLGT